MKIKRIGSQASYKGPADYFTGIVRVDPLFDSPDPLLLGNYLTYTITVSNSGPATATGLVVVDTLPPAVNFISASPTNSYTIVGQVVTFTNTIVAYYAPD